MLLIVNKLFVHTLLFTIYLSFLVIINSILSACDSWVGRGRGPWVLPPQLENILEKTLYICICVCIYIYIYIYSQVHKYWDIDTILTFLALYTTTMDFK